MKPGNHQFVHLLLVLIASVLLVSAIYLTVYFVVVKPNIVCKDPKSGDREYQLPDPGPECTKPCR
jgi:hypothetical protein